MDWVKQQYKDAFFPVLLGAVAFSFAPWMTGPVWFDILGVIVGGYLYITLWLVAKVIWATAEKRMNQNND